MAEPPQRPSNTDAEARTLAAPVLTEPGRSTSAGEEPPLVAGRYEILGMLGSGGMGTVYRARDRELDEIVALKLLRKELAASAGMIERFRREVKLARRVTHKNVARTFDIGDHAGDRFLTMELIDGEMLGMHRARRGRVGVRDVIRIGVDVCAGLAAAHAAGVLHRDLKPENVILARDGRAVITDFGIARAVTEGEHGKTLGGIVGTPAYMARSRSRARPISMAAPTSTRWAPCCSSSSAASPPGLVTPWWRSQRPGSCVHLPTFARRLRRCRKRSRSSC